MKVSQFLLATIKETATDAELVSHRLMIRAGMLRKLASGLYTWLPLGLRVLQKVINIVREEMNRTGALELLMPIVQPISLWKESDRWGAYGAELLSIIDRHENIFCFGPTHEEVITDIARQELKSYKQLPLNFYQIQTKFRDEVRPRFGVMRSREFLMKDAYSFDLDENGMQAAYKKMFDAYNRVFTRLGLNFRTVLADTGAVGGHYSHEFQVIADVGEDTIVYSDSSDYAANIEKATSQTPQGDRLQPSAKMEKIKMLSIHTIQEHFSYKKRIKTLVVKDNKSVLIALILRADHELNSIKAQNVLDVASPLSLANEVEIRQAIGCGADFLGPINLPISFIVDRDAAHLADFLWS